MLESKRKREKRGLFCADMFSSRVLTCLSLLVHLCLNTNLCFVSATSDLPETEAGFFINDPVPSLPLAVKSPFLSAWLPVGSDEPHLAERWPQFWAGQDLGWTGFIKVDKQSYIFMGNPAKYGQKIAKQLFYKVCMRIYLRYGETWHDALTRFDCSC
jgi:hypothetical protein